MSDLTLSLSIGSWASTGVDAFGVTWHTESWTGFEDTPPARIDFPYLAEADGGIDQVGFFAPRMLTWTGNAVAPDEASFAAAKLRWRAAAGDLNNGVDLLVNIHGAQYMTHGKQPPNSPWQSTILANGALAFRYQASITCPDPRLYSAAAHTASASLINQAGGTGQKSYPYSYPYDFGGSGVGAGQMVVSNAGNAVTYPVITVNGPGTNLRLDDQASGAFLIVSSLSAGQYVVIDTRLHTVMLQGVSSARGLLGAGSTFFGIPPGTDSIVFGAATYTTASVQMTWRDAWL